MFEGDKGLMGEGDEGQMERIKDEDGGSEDRQGKTNKEDKGNTRNQ